MVALPRSSIGKDMFAVYRGRNGYGKCGYCGKELPKRRTYWCSQNCIDAIGKECGTIFWADLARKTFERDKYTCLICKQAKKDTWGNLDCECDHIIPYSLAPQKATDLTNLQTLCHNCHRWKTRLDMAAIRRSRARAKWREQNIKLKELPVPELVVDKKLGEW